MNFKKVLVGVPAVLMMSISAATACEINDIDIANLRSSNLVKISEHLASPPQMSLGNQFVQDLKQCNQVRMITLKSKSSGQIYTAIASNEDSCDGGNTFGYVLKGTAILPSALVAMIQDSYIQCL